MKFTAVKLQQAIIELLGEQGYAHVEEKERERCSDEMLILDTCFSGTATDLAWSLVKTTVEFITTQITPRRRYCYGNR